MSSHQLFPSLPRLGPPTRIRTSRITPTLQSLNPTQVPHSHADQNEHPQGDIDIHSPRLLCTRDSPPIKRSLRHVFLHNPHAVHGPPKDYVHRLEPLLPRKRNGQNALTQTLLGCMRRCHHRHLHIQRHH